jgi:hypothetical protein
LFQYEKSPKSMTVTLLVASWHLRNEEGDGLDRRRFMQRIASRVGRGDERREGSSAGKSDPVIQIRIPIFFLS